MAERMNGDMKKTRSDVAASKRATMGAGLDRATTSHVQHTTSSEIRQIADLLSHGPKNGQKIGDLEKLTGWKSREIRAQIEKERRTGTPILSDCRHGYYLPTDPVETEAFVRSMMRRSREIAKTARTVAKGGIT